MTKAYVDKIFESQMAKNGGVVRRKMDNVHKFSSEKELIQAVKDRKFHMVAHGGQYIIFCGKAELQIIL